MWYLNSDQNILITISKMAHKMRTGDKCIIKAGWWMLLVGSSCYSLTHPTLNLINLRVP